jgi:hypothetical protein
MSWEKQPTHDLIDLLVGSLKQAPSFLSWTFKNSFQSPFVPFTPCFWANFTISTSTYSHIHTIINIPYKQFIDSSQCLLCVCSTSKYMNIVPNTCFSPKQNGKWCPKIERWGFYFFFFFLRIPSTQLVILEHIDNRMVIWGV